MENRTFSFETRKSRRPHVVEAVAGVSPATPNVVSTGVLARISATVLPLANGAADEGRRAKARHATSIAVAASWQTAASSHAAAPVWVVMCGRARKRIVTTLPPPVSGTLRHPNAISPVALCPIASPSAGATPHSSAAKTPPPISTRSPMATHGFSPSGGFRLQCRICQRREGRYRHGQSVRAVGLDGG